MYFNAETQRRILARFHFALQNSGVLFLGKAEMLMTHSNLFTPLSLQHRIFSKVPSFNLRDRLLVLAQSGDEEANSRLAMHVRLREAAFNAAPVAQLVVDLNGNLVMANSLARSMLGINRQDLGRPLQDLEISYHPLELRSQIEQIYSDRNPIVITDVSRNLPDGSTQYLDVQFLPLQENGSDLIGISITFTDVSHYHDLQAELQRSNQDLETANEELQSSNEELETTNEELQSTNEELQTINDELRLRTTEVTQVNAFLKSILASIQAGVVVIDRQYNILSWNHEAENLWGLRSEETEGQSFFSLDIGLPVGQLREPIRNCLDEKGGRQEMVLAATNRRGQPTQCRISFNPLSGNEIQLRGVILLMEEVAS